jgi:hypothetical protein
MIWLLFHIRADPNNVSSHIKHNLFTKFQSFSMFFTYNRLLGSTSFCRNIRSKFDRWKNLTFLRVLVRNGWRHVILNAIFGCSCNMWLTSSLCANRRFICKLIQILVIFSDIYIMVHWMTSAPVIVPILSQNNMTFSKVILSYLSQFTLNNLQYSK